METSLDRIEAMIEWRFEANRIVGRIKTRDLDTEREARIRLAGFAFKDRARARENAQISIALEIIKDLFNGQLYDTKQLSNTNPLDDDHQAEKLRTGRGGAGKKRAKQKALNGDGAGGSSD